MELQFNLSQKKKANGQMEMHFQMAADRDTRGRKYLKNEENDYGYTWNKNKYCCHPAEI